MSEGKTNVKKNCGTAYIITAIAAFVLTVISVFIYNFIPASDFASSIDHSAKTALIVLGLSPVCALAAFVTYLVGGLTDKALVKNSVVQLVIFIVSAVLLLVITCISAALLFIQADMGFVSPLNDTVYETLGIVNIVLAVIFTAGNGYIFATGRK